MTWQAALAGADTGFTVTDLTPALLVGAATLLTAVAALRWSSRIGLPSLLLFLALGMVLGEDGLGIAFDSPQLTRALGYAALIVILIEGGLTTKWSSVRRAVAPAAVLSTLGVVVSTGVIAAAAHLLLGMEWPIALMLGAIVASTDAAAVFSVLRSVPLPGRVRGLLEAESGFNDAPVVLAVTALASRASGHSAHEPLFLVADAAFELVGGSMIGIALGWLGARLLRQVASTSSGLFAIAVVSQAVLAYAVADVAHTSGFIATYVSALVLGNSRLPHEPAVHAFVAGIGWLAQIGLFVMLGLLAVPHRLSDQIWPAVLIGMILLLIARPLSVMVSLTPFRIALREQAFLSWAGLRGAVPVVLATIPMAYPELDLAWMFELVLVLVVIFTLVQAPTLPYVARRLGLVEQVHAHALDVESTPLEELGAELIEVHIGPSSRLAGVAVGELRLPRGANVTLVVRNGEGIVPERRMTLGRGDALLIVATSEVRDATTARIRAVSRAGRLAGWNE